MTYIKSSTTMEAGLSIELWARNRKDFGNHLKRYKEWKKASSNFEESLLIQPEYLDSTYELSALLSHEGLNDEASLLLEKRKYLGEVLLIKY